MGKIALFVGAGCSRTLGYPVITEILPLMIKGIKENSLFEKIKDPGNKEYYTCLLKSLLLNVSPGLSNAFVKARRTGLPLITDILSQAEFLLDNNQDITDWNNDAGITNLKKSSRLNERLTLRDIISLLNSAIIEVIQKAGNVDKSEMDPLIKWIKRRNKKINNKDPKKPVTIISTNYDYSIEWNILEYGQAPQVPRLFDYGFAWRDPDPNSSIIHPRPRKAQYKILKLHGSVDWLKCPRCGYIFINPTYNIYEIPLSNDKNNSTKCECGYWPLETVLVTPSYVREYAEPNILQVWQVALEELRAADEWVIAGYSLPTEDFSIRSLLLRALKGRDSWPKITVIQYKKKCLPKYEAFFGKGKFEFFGGGIEKYKYR